MKTNVVLRSEDRNLFGVTVKTETKTGFLNLTDLSEAYEKFRMKEGLSEKRTNDILTQKENSERIFYILKEQWFINVSFNAFIEQIDNHGGFFKYLKKLGVYKTTGARHTKTTWCNPYIWMLAALELHPQIYAKTVVWLTDNLIINRIEAGNMYKGFTSAIAKFKNVDYVQIAKALNYIVFDRHETGIRNFANQSELKELESVEAKVAFAVDMGYIESYIDLLEELRKMYVKKYGKKRLK